MINCFPHKIRLIRASLLTSSVASSLEHERNLKQPQNLLKTRQITRKRKSRLVRDRPRTLDKEPLCVDIKGHVHVISCDRRSLLATNFTTVHSTYRSFVNSVNNPHYVLLFLTLLISDPEEFLKITL